MVNSQGKLQGEGPPKRVLIVWTAGWVEPGDKWMVVNNILLSAAPNILVGPPTDPNTSPAHKIFCFYFRIFSSIPSRGWGQKSLSRRVQLWP